MRVFHCTSCKRKMRIGHFRCDYCESRAPARNWLAIPVAVLLVLMAGVQKRPWAIWANLAVQVLLIAGWVVYPGVGFMGLLFTVVWLLIAYLRAEVLRRQKRGLLPGQQPPTD